MSFICPICCKDFTEDSESIPKILKCGDTICFNCLNEKKEKDTIICPLCSIESNDLENLRTNNFVLNKQNNKKCNLCLNEFNKERIPKVLKCGDTICLNCVNKSYINNKDNDNNIDEFLCPICKQTHKENIDSIPVNKLIMKLIKEEELLLNTKILPIEKPITSFDYEFSIGLIGESGVGKTYLANYFIQEKPLLNYTKKNEYEINFKLISIKNKNIKIKLFDTLGQEVFRNFNISLLKSVDAILIIFSLTQKDSFDFVKTWYEQYKNDFKNKIIYLIGNKSDDDKNRKIKNEEGINLANDLSLEYFETSAMNGNNINKIFLKICLSLMENYELKGKNKEKKFHLVRNNRSNINKKKIKCN